MKLIVGLGNPGKKYQNTRHNIGFLVVDRWAKAEMLSWRISADWLSYFIKTDQYVLIKPTTFMNKSGVATAAVANFFKIDKKDILVIHDDLDLPFGKIRLSFDSISAGHRGIDSIIESLAGVDFGRLRIGIGKPKGKDAEKYVLEEFTEDEKKQIDDTISISIEAIKSYLADGIEATMNRFN